MGTGGEGVRLRGIKPAAYQANSILSPHLAPHRRVVRTDGTDFRYPSSVAALRIRWTTPEGTSRGKPSSGRREHRADQGGALGIVRPAAAVVAEPSVDRVRVHVRQRVAALPELRPAREPLPGRLRRARATSRARRAGRSGGVGTVDGPCQPLVWTAKHSAAHSRPASSGTWPSRGGWRCEAYPGSGRASRPFYGTTPNQGLAARAPINDSVPRSSPRRMLAACSETPSLSANSRASRKPSSQSFFIADSGIKSCAAYLLASHSSCSGRRLRYIALSRIPPASNCFLCLIKCANS